MPELVPYPPCCKCNPPAQPYQYCEACRRALPQRRIQAVETRYKGYRFRSRLEARDACFFDALGIAWEYEKEYSPAGNYLPDFFLPEYPLWVEVKPEAFTLSESEKCSDLCRTTGQPVLQLVGLPAEGPCEVWTLRFGRTLDLYKTRLETIFPPVPSLVRFRAACDMARAARFEHGESGATAPKPAPKLIGRKFLDYIPSLQRGTVANWFLYPIRDGSAKTPPQVIARVRTALAEKVRDSYRYNPEASWQSDTRDKVALLIGALNTHDIDAYNYAAYLLWYESIPYAERQRMKGVAGDLYWSQHVYEAPQ